MIVLYFIYTTTSLNNVSFQDENDNDETDDDLGRMETETESVDEAEVVVLGGGPPIPSGGGKGRKHAFFQRSESTLCLGCPPPDPFDTAMAQALPLADQPHLLLPNARREDLFGIPKQPITVPPSGNTRLCGLSLLSDLINYKTIPKFRIILQVI